MFVLIPSGGIGSRAVAPGAASDVPKQYQIVCDRPLILHTLRVFEALSDLVGGVAVVVAASDGFIDGVLKNRKETILRCGGPTRADTVCRACWPGSTAPGGRARTIGC